MALQSNLKTMVLSLSAVCLVCSAILAGAYAVTQEPIAQAEQNKLNSSLAQVLPDFDGSPAAKAIEVDGIQYPYYEASKDGAVIGYAIESKTPGFGGELKLLVGITPDGHVHNTVVLSHSETPGLGAKCQSDEKFMAQWKELDPGQHTLKNGKLEVSKDGGDIDAITASTITSRAYTKCVNQALSVHEAIIQEK